MSTKPQAGSVPAHLLELAERVEEAAADPRYAPRKEMWTRHNRLEKVAKTPVYVCLKRGRGTNANPVTWSELIPLDTRVSTDPMESDIELQMLQKLYKHDNIPDDEVLLPTIWIDPVRPVAGATGASGDPAQGDDTGGSSDFEGMDAKQAARLWGLEFREVRSGDDPGSAYAVDPVVTTEADLAKLKRPQFTIDKDATTERVERASELVGGRLPIALRLDEVGYAPTEVMISLMGMEAVLYGVYDRPEFIHRIMEFITDAMIEYHLEREKAGGVDSEQTWGYRMPYEEIPTGADRYSLELGWASIAAQSMVGLSPAMYEEFAQPYHERLAQVVSKDRIYYHGCEDLTKKLSIIRKLPNLRRFHISPWTDVEAAVDELGRDFVMEVVGHPDTLHVQTETEMRDWLERTMEIAGDSIFDLNLGEIETVFGDPSVLRRWAEIAQDVAERYS
ncbi:MAG: uroporphyrinogen decarboxylase family protein [Dehalococcoidia bacterium]|nr:uroporphyrinogen decarboxylase family protein [Dehalococcoidia bacterium]